MHIEIYADLIFVDLLGSDNQVLWATIILNYLLSLVGADFIDLINNLLVIDENVLYAIVLAVAIKRHLINIFDFFIQILGDKLQLAFRTEFEENLLLGVLQEFDSLLHRVGLEIRLADQLVSHLIQNLFKKLESHVVVQVKLSPGRYLVAHMADVYFVIWF